MFEIIHKSGSARTGLLHTAHGKVHTPFFMPVATKASVKSIEGEKVEELGYEAIISNAFILSLNPGIKTIKDIGGIHKFMNFNKTIFTDSGGFQVLSKEFLKKKTDKGVLFKNPRTGDSAIFTPEISVENQLALGSDVAMTLDDVPHHGLDGKNYVDSIKRTHEWAKRSLMHHKLMKEEYGGKQLIFGIAQGGIDPHYRTFSTNKLNRMDFDGVALGGLVVGEKRDELIDAIKVSVGNLDDHKVKYLMGLGSPPDIVRAAGFGVDCFDSTYPTENARHGSMLTDYGRMNLMKKEYSNDTGPIMDGCRCETCRKYPKAYVQHLLKMHELLGYRLATIHNLHYMSNLMERIRKAIEKNDYERFEKEFLEKYFSGKEKREFSNHIKMKYMEKEKKRKAVLHLEHKA